jgi:signal transduction histidine kinase/DNA-binding response OmpR family regulator
MKKTTDINKIYEREFQLLEKIKEIVNNKTLSKDELLKKYTELGKEYDKLLKQAIKITKIGDANQRKSMHSWKLEEEKLHLEKIVKERTKEIEEKNRQLEEQSGKLKEMDRVKSRFLANISHEFRTPLTLIMGPLEQMLSDCPEKDQKKKLGLMLRNSQRLLGLINQLLELSKFESGKVKLQAGRLNILPFLKGITASFEPLATQKELALIFHPGIEEIALYFDPEKLENVLFNLLSNAIKFTPPGGKITISQKFLRGSRGQFFQKAPPGRRRQKIPDFPADVLEIVVSDTGPGIPRDQLSHIFDRFYQSDSTYEYHRKGSGIGLAIAKELVELHHGTIEVHSRQNEDRGTDFIIRLPMGDTHLKPDEMVEISEIPSLRRAPAGIPSLDVMEKEEAEPEPGPGIIDVESAEAIRTGKNIILVVEDVADVRDYIRGALGPTYKVLEAADGREGIQMAREIIPDLIISDIMMPGADGYELCRVLKKEKPTSHIPIILLTAKAAEENIIKGLETGADDYVTKPFNTKILGARIKNLIDLRRHLQQTIDREMTLQPTKLAVSPVDKEFITDLKEVIEKNISNPGFNVEELCRRLYMSHATLYRKINALTGESPTEFIRSYRLKRGAELLKSDFGSILEVALEVGFSSANYFTKCFKKKFHQLPSTFKEIE